MFSNPNELNINIFLKIYINISYLRRVLKNIEESNMKTFTRRKEILRPNITKIDYCYYLIYVRQSILIISYISY